MYEDLNLYINFLLYAVVGRMAEADDILRKYKEQIYRAAACSLRGFQTTDLLYRGILLSSHEVRDGKVFGKDGMTFVSFSQDKDVACWFADVNSIMSSYVKQIRPDVSGYMIEAQVRLPDAFLFVASAQPELCHLLGIAAETHPHIDANQLRWNLATQKEVILKPLYDHFDVKPYSSTPEETWRLDLLFTHPMFREEKNGQG